jgi:hypothetical protein
LPNFEALIEFWGARPKCSRTLVLKAKWSGTAFTANLSQCKPLATHVKNLLIANFGVIRSSLRRQAHSFKNWEWQLGEFIA